MKKKKTNNPVIIFVVVGIFLCLLFLLSIRQYFMKGISKPFPQASVIEQNLLVSSEEIQMFPAPRKDMKRFVVKIPPPNNEANQKIQIIVGKMMWVDCNHHGLNGSIKEINLDGSGYSYLEVSVSGGTVSTKMGCPGYINKYKFVPLWGEPFVYTYNNKTPVVLYAPQGLEVYYKLSSESELLYKAQAL